MQMRPDAADDRPHFHLGKHDETGEPIAVLIYTMRDGKNMMLSWDHGAFEEFVEQAHALLHTMQVICADFFLVDCRSLGEREHLIRAADVDRQARARGRAKHVLPALCGAGPGRGDDWSFAPLVEPPCRDCTCEGCLAIYEQEQLEKIEHYHA